MKVYQRWNYKQTPDFLFETDKNIDIGEVIKYRDRHYVVGSLDKKNSIAEVRLLKNFTNLNAVLQHRAEEYSDSYELICPVCGEHIDDEPREPDMIECPNCGAELQVDVEYVVYYSPVVMRVPMVKDLDEE